MKAIGLIFSAFALVVSVSGYYRPVGSPRIQPDPSCAPDTHSLVVVLANGRIVDRCSVADNSFFLTQDELIKEPQYVIWENGHFSQNYTVLLYYHTADLCILELGYSNIGCYDLKEGNVFKGKGLLKYQVADPGNEPTGTQHFLVLRETEPCQKVVLESDPQNFDPDLFYQQGLEGPVAGLSVPIRQNNW